MCCLLATFMLIGPRGLGILWWLVEPLRWQVTFNGSFIIPFLGILFLPWTTLAYLVCCARRRDGWRVHPRGPGPAAGHRVLRGWIFLQLATFAAHNGVPRGLTGRNCRGTAIGVESSW